MRDDFPQGVNASAEAALPLRIRSEQEEFERSLLRIDYVLSLLTGCLALLIYLRTLAPGVLGGDSGEFQFAAWLGGFAHPTGYPLYLLLGYLWTHLLPMHDPAWRMNLFSAVWGAAAVGLVYLLVRSVLRVATPLRSRSVQIALALWAALTFAVNPTFWSQAVVAEVYTLHAFFVAAVLLGLVALIRSSQDGPHSGHRLLPWIAGIYGLSLTHHRTMLLLLPAMLVFLWSMRERNKHWRHRLPGLARVLLFLLLPLLLYLYIPLRAPHVPYVHLAISPTQTLELYQNDIPGFLAYVTGQAFQGEFRSVSQAVDRLLPSIWLLLDEFSLPGVVLGVLGSFWLARRRRNLWLLTGLSFLALVTFNLFYGIGDIYVFFIPVYLIWVVWAALGVVMVIEATEAILRIRANVPVTGAAQLAPALVLIVLAFLLPFGLLLSGYRHVDQSQNTAARTTWDAILAEPVPVGAILVSNDRDEMTPLLYYQHVEGKRTDLTGLFPLIAPGPQWTDIGQVIDQALLSGRPVLLIKAMPGMEVKARLEPAGPMVRVLGQAVEKPPEKPRSIAFADTIRLAGYNVRPGLVSGGSTITVTLYWQPLRSIARDYTTFVHLQNADGETVGQEDHRPGGDYYPSHFWRPGDLLKDVHEFSLRADLGPAPYTIVAGLYTLDPDIQHLGQPTAVGFVGQQRPLDVPPANIARPLNFILNDQISLNGYDMELQDETLQLRLYWQTVRTPALDYTVFVHVLDANDRIVAQRDQQPGGGQMPTSTWPQGFTLADPVTIVLPPNLPAGSYRLVAGMYDPATVKPLPVSDVNGQPVGTQAALGVIDLPEGSHSPGSR